MPAQSFWRTVGGSCALNIAPEPKWIPLLLAVAACAFLPSRAVAAFDPYEGPKPLAVYHQIDGWGALNGRKNPVSVIYENGEVICGKPIGRAIFYRHAKLAGPQLKEALDKIGAVTALNGLKPSYDAVPQITDQPCALFYFRAGSAELGIRVTGWWEGTTHYPRPPRGWKAEPAPKELEEFHKWILALEPLNAAPWSPNYAEVIFHRGDFRKHFSHLKEFQWPDAWPQFDSERALLRGQANSIFVDGSLIPELNKLVGIEQPFSRITDLDGQTWGVSFRPTFPSEPVWLKALKIWPQVP